MVISQKRMQMMHVVALACLFAAGCAAGDPRFTLDDPAGFWLGLWHGLIAFITLIVGIFYDGVEVYERFNGGGWYDFGFLLGVGCFSGSGHHSHRKWRAGRLCKSEQSSGRGSARINVDVSWDSEDSDEPAGSQGPPA